MLPSSEISFFNVPEKMMLFVLTPWKRNKDFLPLKIPVDFPTLPLEAKKIKKQILSIS